MFRDATVSLAAKVLYMLSRLVLPPLILAHVTLEEYGIWSTCFVIIAYFGMSAFGISNVYIKAAAEFDAHGDPGQVNAVVATGFFLTLGIVAVVLPGIWLSLPGIIAAFQISEHLVETARILFMGTVASFALDLSLGLSSYLLLGMRRFVTWNVTWVLSFLLEAGIIVAGLQLGYGILSLLAAFAIRTVFQVGINWLVVLKAFPAVSLHPRHVSRSAFRSIAGFGGWVQIAGMLGMFLYSLEKFLAGIIFGAKATGILDLAEKFPVMASQIPSSLNTLFFPEMARYQAKNDTAAVARVYLEGSRALSLVTGWGMAFLMGFSAPILTAWLGPRENLGTLVAIQVLFCLPYHLHILTGPGTALHRGMGHPHRELFYPLVQLVCIGVALGVFWGLETLDLFHLCLAVALGMGISAVLYMGVSNRAIGLTQGRFLLHVLGAGLVPYAIAWGMASILLDWLLVQPGRLIILGKLSATGVGYGLVGAAVIAIMLTPEERGMLRRKLLRERT